MLDRKTLEYLKETIELTFAHIDQHYAGNSEQFRLGMKSAHIQLVEFLETQLEDADQKAQR